MIWWRDPDKKYEHPQEPTPEHARALGPSGITDLPPALGYPRPDPAQAPPRDEIPAPAVPTPPHCNGQHGRTTIDGCDWCDALADMATALRHQEDRIRRIEARLGSVETTPEERALVNALVDEYRRNERGAR